MDDNAAGEIFHAPFLQDAAAPDHVNEGEVHQQQPTGQEDHVGVESDPVGKRAGDQGRRDDGEHHLVRDEDDDGNGIVHGGRHVERHSVKKRHIEITDDSRTSPWLCVPEKHSE